jgi:hypothetical protein
MLSQQTPLSNINSNQQGRGAKLSPYQRGEIVGMRKSGKSPREIELETSLLQRAICNTLDIAEVCDKGKTLP